MRRWPALPDAPGEQSTQPGAGACGGLGLAVLALGGRLTTGPECASGRLSTAPVELVVTGCTVFDFASRGGGVVAAAARLRPSCSARAW